VRIDKFGTVTRRDYYRHTEGRTVEDISASTYRRHVNEGVPFRVNLYAPPEADYDGKEEGEDEDN
jgi:hypothetical protein